ncbi:maltokinase N-terminal cap-like domain-containing protein [Streptomyces sp. LMG1-1-1.1]|uniref:maltokinase N-terminal cap-like domain-containing protein n=1 Tax=Streptomyces sp. LMG1-1-1.1 TaxID=3135245 RepID=UPI0034654521
MAVIHHTTMQPTKLELLTEWLPTRAWYTATEGGPRPAKAGGFRLDDPAGEVGIEFMAVTDGPEDDAVVHLIPMTYRGAPLQGAEHALIGTSEHGVLGTRWIYDGTHDPVLVAQLYALLAGRAQAQHQSVDDTPDPTVAATLAADADAAELVRATDGPDRTDILVRPLGAPAGAELTLRVRRVLRPGPDTAPAAGRVTAEWRLPDGTTARGAYADVLAAGAVG